MISRDDLGISFVVYFLMYLMPQNYVYAQLVKNVGFLNDCCMFFH